MEDESLMFNLEDIDINQEALDFIEQPDPATPEPEKPDVETQVEEKEIKVEDTNPEDNTKGDQTPSSDTDDSSHSTLYTLAKHLKEEGVLHLNEDIEKVESLDDLKDLIRKSNEQAKYVGLSESQKRYQEALANGIPQKEYETVEREIQNLTRIKEEDIVSNEQLRFEINALDLIEKGLDKEKALKLAKLSLTDESNVNDSKEALRNLIENKKAKFKSLVEDSQKKTELTLDEIKKSVYSKEKFLDTPLNDITKNKLFDLMTTKVESDESTGMPLNEFQKWQKENPIEANIFVNYMWMMTNKGKDLGLIKKSSTSDAAKDLERKLKTLSFDETGALLIPDEMVSGRRKGNQDRFSTGNDLTINI